MEKPLELSELGALSRFADLEEDFMLTKIGSKRASMVGVGKREVGNFSFHEYPATDTLPAGIGVFITGYGFSFLRTSPIVKIVDQNETSTTFETEGGIYRLEKYVPVSQLQN